MDDELVPSAGFGGRGASSVGAWTTFGVPEALTALGSAAGAGLVLVAALTGALIVLAVRLARVSC
jgi:hypothetical protein